jgi:peroxiredoxin Q/BCP
MNHKTILVLILLLIPALALAKSKKIKNLKVGDLAPAFSLPDETGKLRSPLTEFKNQKIVLYFYPKDGTPDCTKEACQLRDAFDTYQAHKINIFGINYDSVKAHAKFKAKHNLPFPLLADTDKKVANLYSANNNLLGRFYPQRKTVLIFQGKIIAVIEDVNLKSHVDDILKAFAN